MLEDVLIGELGFLYGCSRYFPFLLLYSLLLPLIIGVF